MQASLFKRVLNFCTLTCDHRALWENPSFCGAQANREHRELSPAFCRKEIQAWEDPCPDLQLDGSCPKLSSTWCMRTCGCWQGGNVTKGSCFSILPWCKQQLGLFSVFLRIRVTPLTSEIPVPLPENLGSCPVAQICAWHRKAQPCFTRDNIRLHLQSPDRTFSGRRVSC